MMQSYRPSLKIALFLSLQDCIVLINPNLTSLFEKKKKNITSTRGGGQICEKA